MSCQALGLARMDGLCRKRVRRRLRGNPNSVSGVQPGLCHIQEDFLQIFEEKDQPCFQLRIPEDDVPHTSPHTLLP